MARRIAGRVRSAMGIGPLRRGKRETIWLATVWGRPHKSARPSGGNGVRHPPSFGGTQSLSASSHGQHLIPYCQGFPIPHTGRHRPSQSHDRQGRRGLRSCWRRAGSGHPEFHQGSRHRGAARRPHQVHSGRRHPGTPRGAFRQVQERQQPQLRRQPDLRDRRCQDGLLQRHSRCD